MFYNAGEYVTYVISSPFNHLLLTLVGDGPIIMFMYIEFEENIYVDCANTAKRTPTVYGAIGCIHYQHQRRIARHCGTFRKQPSLSHTNPAQQTNNTTRSGTSAAAFVQKQHATAQHPNKGRVVAR